MKRASLHGKTQGHKIVSNVILRGLVIPVKKI